MSPRRGITLPSEPPVEWTLVDLFTVFARRRRWIFLSVAACLALALLYGVCSTRRYRATAEIEMQKQSHGAFGLESATSDKTASDVSDSLSDNLSLQTEIGILESDAVTMDVIQRTGLETSSDYWGPGAAAPAGVHRLFFWKKAVEPLSVPLAEAPSRRDAAIRIFARHRRIAPVAGTRLIAISYSDSDPRRAAAVVTALLQALFDYRFQSRSSAAAQSASWLRMQLADVRAQTEALDARAAALDRVAGSFGDEDAHNVVLARLDSLNTALSAAESNRIVREAIWRAVQSGDAEVLSGLGGTTATGANTQNSFALLQALRTQEAAARSQLAEASKRYGENWPAVAEERARLEAVEKAIQDEVHRLGDRAHSDYEVSLQAENAARDALQRQKELASRLTGNALSLRLARQEADASRTLYTTLLGRLQETGVLEGLHSGNISVVSPALVPASDHPSSPNLPLLFAVGAGAGIVAGCTAAVVCELTDHSVRSAAELEALLDAPVFAVMPTARPPMSGLLRLPGRSLLLAEAAEAPGVSLPTPHSPLAEALHCLRASLLLSHGGRAPQVITLVAAGGEKRGLAERPSATESLAPGLASVLAQHGSPVLFVDADLRSGPTAVAAGQPGLSEFLTDESLAEPVEQVDALPMLSRIVSGARPPCPAELIASSRMQCLLARWREQFGFVVIRGSAAPFAEALVLAQLSDAVLITARAGETRRSDVAAAYQALRRQVSEDAVLGLILEVPPNGGPYARA